MRTAIYPGSFDPFTNGHLDIVQRAIKLFDNVIVAVANNEGKKPLFTLEERVGLVKKSVRGFPNVTVDSFNGLLVNYVEERGGQAVIRGLRAISDFEFEFQLALMNRKLEPTLETVFMMPADKYSYVSSRLVREVAQAGGPVKGLVPEVVEQKLREKLEPGWLARRGTPAAGLQVYAPVHARSGIVYAARFRIDADRELKNATLLLDPGWAEQYTVNGMSPQPLTQGSHEGKLVFGFGHIPKGGHLLFFLSLVPLVIRWIDQTGMRPLPVASYGFVLLMAGAAYQLIELALAAVEGPDSVVAEAVGGRFKEWISIGAYLGGMLLAWVSPLISIALYVCVAATWLVPDRRFEKRLKP